MQDCIPMALLSVKGDLMVRWIDAAGADYRLPFLARTIERQVRLGCEQRLIALDSLYPKSYRPPSGFIFHESRCGSTLACRMLGALEGLRVISEPPVINQLLSMPQLDESVRLRSLDRLLTALSPDQGREYVVKLTSWNVLYIDVFRRLYPSVPWLFIYREPSEVMHSHERDPAPWLKHNLDTGNIESYLRLGETLGRYCDSALRRYALDQATGGARLVSYANLKRELPVIAAKLFGLQVTADDVRAMRAATSVHAKHIERRWCGDDLHMRNPGAIDEAVRRYLQGPFAELERLSWRPRVCPTTV